LSERTSRWRPVEDRRSHRIASAAGSGSFSRPDSVCAGGGSPPPVKGSSRWRSCLERPLGRRREPVTRLLPMTPRPRSRRPARRRRSVVVNSLPLPLRPGRGRSPAAAIASATCHHPACSGPRLSPNPRIAAGPTGRSPRASSSCSRYYRAFRTRLLGRLRTPPRPPLPGSIAAVRCAARETCRSLGVSKLRPSVSLPSHLAPKAEPIRAALKRSVRTRRRRTWRTVRSPYRPPPPPPPPPPPRPQPRKAGRGARLGASRCRIRSRAGLRRPGRGCRPRSSSRSFR